MSHPSSPRSLNPLEAHQIAVKFYADRAAGLSPRDFVPIFHKWIQEHRLKEEVMIDVADYSHVYHGPGVMLLCHAGRYGLDQGEGRLGLLYARKRESQGDARFRLRQTFHTALKACTLLEKEPILEEKLRFRGDEVLFLIYNRLLAPNAPESFEALEDGLLPFLHELYVDAKQIQLARVGGIKDPFAVRITADSTSTAEQLISRLGH